MKALLLGLFAGTLGAIAYGCSATGDPVGETSGAGNSGTGNAANAGSGADGTGASGVGGIDIGGMGGSGQDAGVCNTIAAEAHPALQPADIVFAIDTSGSMGEESSFVKTEMNAFSQQIIDSGIDVHVIMLAEPPPPIPCFGPICPPGICIGMPLGSGACPNDSNPPHYFHVANSEVASNDGLNVLYDKYPEYSGQLRPDATKSLVVVTDDNATQAPMNDATTFIDAYTALDPALLTDFVMHGIYCAGTGGDCAAAGTVWADVITATGGIHGELSNQDFQPIFDALAEEIIIGSTQLECQWDIPTPPDGETLDPAKLNVLFTAGDGTETSILNVSNAAACDPTQGGWYYDDNANPTKVHLCPASCDFVQADPNGKIDLLFGCATEILPPPA